MIAPDESVDDSSRSATDTKCTKKIADYFIDNDIPVNKSTQIDSGGVFDTNNYWYLKAEDARKELSTALEENKRLCELKAILEEENLLYIKKLEEVQSFVEVYNEVVQDTADDTGIDLETSDSYENLSNN